MAVRDICACSTHRPSFCVRASDKTLQVVIVLDGAIEAVAVVPAFMKRFEDVDQLALRKAVKVGNCVYVVGGDTGTVTPVLATLSGTETGAVHLGKINVRDGTLTSWSATAAMNKGRSKHSTIVAGGSLLTTSGVYSGAVGSSENTYATINADGTLTSWAGATGSNTIQVLLGDGLYNAAAASFIDATGKGHVLVLGGAKRSTQGTPSAAVVYY